jgi:site-specific recombinase XerD
LNPRAREFTETMTSTQHGPITGFPPAIAEIVDDFLVTKRLEEGRSENTIRAYRHDLVMFFRFLDGLTSEIGGKITTIAAVKVPHIKRFLVSLDDRGYTKAGLARKIATLKSLFSHALFMGYIQINPMDRVKSPNMSAAEHLPKFLTKEEMNRVLDHVLAKQWIQEYIMLRFMYATMCRVSELCGLAVKDFDTTRGIVHLRGKGNKERWVPVDEKTIALITKFIIPARQGSEAPLFTNHRGEQLHPRVVEALFQKIKQELGFPADKKMTPHVFRHTGATMLRRNGMDISELQDLLGHANPNTTRIYAKNDIETISNSYRKMHPLNQ